jgi:HIV Tat-specific factor 1
VKFEDVPSAHACIEVMHGRMFAGRKLVAEMWDGHTSYKVEESDMEREARIKKWEQDLEAEAEADGKS